MTRLQPLSAPAHSDPEAGFSLVEILVGVVALAIALGMAGAMNGVATRGLRSSTTINDRNAVVDADIAQVRSLAERYTWCSGAPTSTVPSSATCLSQDPADESYYSPAVSLVESIDNPGAGNVNMSRFNQACGNYSLTAGLVTMIGALPPIEGINRTVTALASSHRIQVQYSTAREDSDPLVRTVMIVPTVASWCP